MLFAMPLQHRRLCCGLQLVDSRRYAYTRHGDDDQPLKLQALQCNNAEARHFLYNIVSHL